MRRDGDLSLTAFLFRFRYGFEALIKICVPQFAVQLGFGSLAVGALIGIIIAFVVGLLLISYFSLWRVTVAAMQRAKWLDESGKTRTVKNTIGKKEMQEVAAKAEAASNMV